MNTAKQFDKLVDKYHETYGKNPEYNYYLEEFMTFVKKGKVLDLGCGAGIPVASSLFKHGYEVTGVDISKKMIAAAVKNVPKAMFIYEDMRKLELEPESYDGVVAFFSFNYLNKKELEKLLAKLRDALQDNGAIALTVVEGDGETKSKTLGEELSVTLLNEETLRSYLKGFKIELVERREFSVDSDPVQKQLFIIASKISHYELEEEKSAESEEVKAPETPHEEDDDDEGPAIKITLFKKSRKKK
jgi:predicted TPR repeat methyltransferase